jgi:hypothetical protein
MLLSRVAYCDELSHGKKCDGRQPNLPTA